MCLFAVTLGMLTTAVLAATPPAIQSEMFVLDNGLRVVLAEDHSTPLVAVDLWYGVGSRDEEPGRTGFAHLFEHLMFQGSPAQPDEFFAPLEAVGATINGTTNSDRTNYFEVLPRENLPLALFLEADRMGGLLTVLDQARLDNQREVVRNERRQRVENIPYGDVRAVLARNLYPTGHGYHHPTIGSHSDLEAATLADVSAFFRRWYAPDHAVLVIVGDFEGSMARSLVERWFAPIPSSSATPSLPSAAPAWPALPASVTITERRAVPLRRVWLTWHTPPRSGLGDDELDVLASLLAGGRGGRLVKSLVEERQIAQEVTVSSSSSEWSSTWTVSATAAPGHETTEIVAAIDAEIEALLTGTAPLTEAEISGAVAAHEWQLVSSLETVLGKAEIIQQCLRYEGQPDCVAQRLARMAAVTPRSVLETAQTFLRAPRVVLHILPDESNGSTLTSAPASAAGGAP